MIFHYFKLAFRLLLRNRGLNGLSLFGLAIGVASFLLIALWIRDELSFDRFHPKGERIYRAIWDARVGDNAWQIPLDPVPLGHVLTQFPEVEQSVRFYATSRWVKHDGSLLEEKHFIYTEPAFCRIFSLEPIDGDPSTALMAPDGLVVTRSAALRYFGKTDVQGYTIEMSDGKTYRINAIVEDFPPQSHLHFAILAPIEKLPIFVNRKDQWGSATCYTYLLLRDGASIDGLSRKLAAYVKEEIVNKDPLYAKGQNRTGFAFQRLFDIHLKSELEYELEPPGNLKTVYLLGGVGILVLLLACVNFVNLFTARASRRAREVGVRKAIGSVRAQLLAQFFTEAGLLVLFAVASGSLIAEVATPALNELAAKQLAISYLDPAVCIFLLLLFIAVTLLSGVYPAIMLSRSEPVQALKGQLGEGRANTRMRNALVVFQFCICVGMMIVLAVVRNQMNFMMEKDLGFNREHVLVVRGASALGENQSAFAHELEASTQVMAASLAQTLPGFEFDSNLFEPEQPSNYSQTSLTYAMVDARFLDVMQIGIVSGRNFSEDMPTDSFAILINRAAANTLGWKNPLGKKLKSGNMGWHVIGVVGDFNFESLRSGIKPIVFPYILWTPQYVAVRLAPGKVPDQVAYVESTWKKFIPGRPFDYSFLDADYEALYRNERKFADILALFTSLAFAVACLGLFGLAAHSVQQRTKEIGIRKVLGASIPGIIGMLSGQFLRLVALGSLVASPLAYVAATKWLESYAYRVDVGLFVFLGAAVVALCIAFVTVSVQAFKAALANPAEALRYE